MSNNVNTELLERAAEMMDYYVDKQPAQRIEMALKNKDLDQLRYEVSNAEALAAQTEMEASDVY